jgi:carboxyl-terminal processing protease
MENKTGRIILYTFIGLILIAGAFSGGVWVGYFMPNAITAGSNLLPSGNSTTTSQTSATPETIITPPPDTTTGLFSPFWQAWELVHQQYVDQPVNDTTLMQGAIKGMLDSLGDAHTTYMSPEESQQASADLSGYDGIGAYVDTTTKNLTIVSPIPGSPAEAAGLKPGDVIIAVDKKDVTSDTPTAVLQMVLGKAGTPVTLTIQRPNVDKPFDVTITRAHIVIPTIQGKMLSGNIAYIDLSTFGQTTADDLTAELKQLLAQNPKGLILDLRDDGGGYLDTAVAVISQFVDQGTVLIEQYGDGTRDTYSAKPGGLATKVKLVVLVNAGTASASEITAGAIQDYKRGILIGTTTYGKGSVQVWTDLVNGQGGVRITVAQWLTPNGRQINGVGLTPDIVVDRTQDDITAGKDPQLDRAIQYLTNGQ